MSLPACPYIEPRGETGVCGAVDTIGVEFALVHCSAPPRELIAYGAGLMSCQGLLLAELCPEGWR